MSTTEVERCYYTPPEAVAATGIPRTKLYELMATGQLGYSQIGRHRYISREAIDELMFRHRDGGGDAICP